MVQNECLKAVRKENVIEAKKKKNPLGLFFNRNEGNHL